MKQTRRSRLNYGRRAKLVATLVVGPSLLGLGIVRLFWSTYHSGIDGTPAPVPRFGELIHPAITACIVIWGFIVFGAIVWRYLIWPEFFQTPK